MPTTATLVPVVTLPNSSNQQAPYGVATVTVPASVTPGTYAITVSYSGDTNYNATSGQGSFPFVAGATQLASTTTATASANATSPTAAVNVTLTVAGQSGHAAPTGVVYFYASGNNLGGVALPASTGSSVTTTVALNSEFLVQGTNLISVQYAGDATYLPSVATLNVVNTLSDFSLIPATVIVAVPSSGIATDAISVASHNGFAGTVNLTCTAATGVTCSLSPTSATLTAAGNATSTLTINTAGVSAAGNYNVVVTGTDAATGAFIHTLTITANTGLITAKSFSLSNNGAITIATQGASGTSTITITPTNSFTGNVTLSCAVTTSPASAIHPATCSIPTPATISGTTAATATLTISTTANTAALQGLPLERFFAAGGSLAMAALLFFGFPLRRRSGRSLLGVLVFAVVLSVGLGLAGCGGGTSTSSGGTTTTPTNNGTTVGTYTVTVTGTDAATSAITSTTAVTVNVN
jgi:hypothetical protein